MPKTSAQPAIILIHGLRGNHFGVQDIAETLTKKYGYQVFAPDLPGSGTRPELKDKTLDGHGNLRYNKKREMIFDYEYKKDTCSADSTGNSYIMYFVFVG